MNSSKLPLQLRMKVSRNGLWAVLSRPAYAAIVYVAFWNTLGLLVWLTNWQLLTDYLFSGSHSLPDRASFFLNGYTSLLTNFSIVSASILVIFALLSGLNASLLIFVVSQSFNEAVKSGSGNIVSIIAAAIGTGCAACGTSFLAPLLTGVSGAASITLTMSIGVIANVLGLALLTYSIYRLGQTAASLAARQN